MRVKLPIEDALPSLKQALENGRNVLVTASPGAGKTTVVPLALLHEPWLAGRRILMLEPRRLATRSAARFMASQLQEGVGETVGYRIKGDACVSAKTRIEVLTEGILTRMLQSDPGLEGVGAVIFDEFHERSIHADVGLALCLQCQQWFREDLRLLVMSATLDTDSVCQLLSDAPVIACEGRMFPIETKHIDPLKEKSLEMNVVNVVNEAIRYSPVGDILVFLPGRKEIRRTQILLEASLSSDSFQISPLHSSLTTDQQDEAISPSRNGKRKIVLATNIAETSLTVEGVRIVIDSGISRIAKFSPRTAMTRLETVPVTLASANQRRGRAGRVGPGICYRLWSIQEHHQLRLHNDPEILLSDLSSVALDLAAWGQIEPSALRWITPPPEGAYRQALELLEMLGALGVDGNLTTEGQRMAQLGIHPRLARMLLSSLRLGKGYVASEVAVLMQEGNQFCGDVIDLRDKIEALRRDNTPESIRLRQEASRLRAELNISQRFHSDFKVVGELCALAYPDRIGQRRIDAKYNLTGGRGAALPEEHPLSREQYLAIVELDGDQADNRIRMATPITLESINRLFSNQIRTIEEIEWDPKAAAVRSRWKRQLGTVVLEYTPLASPDSEKVKFAMLHGIRNEGLRVLPWTKSALQWQERVLFLREQGFLEFPNLSEQWLLEHLEQWLVPYLEGTRSIADLTKLSLRDMLVSLCSWEQQQQIERRAPTHVTVPSGSRIPIDYNNPLAPCIQVRLQEVFGWEETPKIAEERVPITIVLLSPANRPVQVTKDLANFWKQTYFEIKKDLKGRYPKHYWPDDPALAIATRGTRPKIT